MLLATESQSTGLLDAREDCLKELVRIFIEVEPLRACVDVRHIIFSCQFEMPTLTNS